MSFLDNLLREGTEAVLGHVRGTRLAEEETRFRRIQDDEIEQQAQRDATAATLDRERLRKFVDDRRAKSLADELAQSDEQDRRAALTVAYPDADPVVLDGIDDVGTRQLLTDALDPIDPDGTGASFDIRLKAIKDRDPEIGDIEAAGIAVDEVTFRRFMAGDDARDPVAVQRFIAGRNRYQGAVEAISTLRNDLSPGGRRLQRDETAMAAKITQILTLRGFLEEGEDTTVGLQRLISFGKELISAEGSGTFLPGEEGEPSDEELIGFFEGLSDEEKQEIRELLTSGG